MTEDEIRWVVNAAQIYGCVVILIQNKRGTQALLFPKVLTEGTPRQVEIVRSRVLVRG